MSPILSESRKARKTRKTRKGFLYISGFLLQDGVILTETLFFRVLCVLCVIRDSDKNFTHPNTIILLDNSSYVCYIKLAIKLRSALNK